MDPDETQKSEKEKKKAEVRARLEAAAAAKKGKKGFMTAERKKRLKNLMRQKAAEELKKEMERRGQERKRIIAERAGTPKNLDVSEEELIDICKQYHERIAGLENEKFDLQFDTRRKDMILTEFNMHLQDLKGKFVKPNLKKVRNYQLKLEKMQAAALKVDFRGNLKKVKSGVLNFDNSSGANSPSSPQPQSWSSDAKS